MKNPVFILVLICGVVAMVLAYLKLMNNQWFPASMLFAIGVSVILMSIWLLRFLHSQEIPIAISQSVSEMVSQTGTIMMKMSKQERNDTLFWVVGCLYGAVWLVYAPDILWRWWISYPAAFLLILLVPILLFAFMGQDLVRIVADAQGIEIRTESRSITKVDQKVAWRDVAAIKIIEYWAKEPNAPVYSQLHNKFIERELVLLDREGKELLQLDDPLDPPQAYQRFLDSVPVWTKLTIRKERVEK
jgi:uncharacterized membrane protein (UPF0136 family)